MFKDGDEIVFTDFGQNQGVSLNKVYKVKSVPGYVAVITGDNGWDHDLHAMINMYGAKVMLASAQNSLSTTGYTSGYNGSKPLVQYRKGDQVRCLTDYTSIGGNRIFTKGKIYTVVHDTGHSVRVIRDDGVEDGWGYSNFELVTNSAPREFLTGDKVNYIGPDDSLRGMVGTVTYVYPNDYVVDWGRYSGVYKVDVLIPAYSIGVDMAQCTHKNLKKYIGLCNKFDYCDNCSWKGPETLIHE